MSPTKRLIVSGWYRDVRNPMLVAVLALPSHAFVTGDEEPTLRATHGD